MTKEKDKKKEKAKEKVKGEETKKISKQEIEKIILELAEKGLTAEKIGLVLKDEYGIRNVKREIGKRIGQILKEHGKFTDPDITNLKKIIDRIKKHTEKHKHDYTAKRALLTKLGKFNRFNKYRKK